MILAIDTATRWAGLALHDGTAVLAEHGWHCQNNHTVEMTPAITDMLARLSLTTADLSGIAVAIGPGSYTGLRVGLALAKGLALVHGIPLLGVSTLDVVAAGFGPADSQLVAVIAAGRRRITAAGYKWHGRSRWQTAWGPRNATWDELLPDVAAPAFFAGEIPAEAAKKIRQANRGFTVAAAARSVRRSALLAELGWQRLQADKVDDPATLVPVYMRDAAGKATAVNNESA